MLIVFVLLFSCCSINGWKVCLPLWVCQDPVAKKPAISMLNDNRSVALTGLQISLCGTALNRGTPQQMQGPTQRILFADFRSAFDTIITSLELSVFPAIWQQIDSFPIGPGHSRMRLGGTAPQRTQLSNSSSLQRNWSRCWGQHNLAMTTFKTVTMFLDFRKSIPCCGCPSHYPTSSSWEIQSLGPEDVLPAAAEKARLAMGFVEDKS